MHLSSHEPAESSGEPTVARWQPPAPLDRWIECLWYLRRETCAHTRERALPGGTMDLIVNLSEDRFVSFRDDDDRVGRTLPGAIVAGAYARHFVIDTARPRAVVGVHFKPGGAARFLGVPAHLLCDAHVALEDLWGHDATRLRERLLHADSIAERFALLQRALLARLAPPPAHYPAIAYALARFDAQSGVASVATVRDDAGFGAKRFIDLFRASVGLAPKRYCRVRRLERVVARLATGGRVDWAAVAADSGYCDQSHLNREFRAFAGVTPAQYRPLTQDRPLHMAADA